MKTEPREPIRQVVHVGRAQYKVAVQLAKGLSYIPPGGLRFEIGLFRYQDWDGDWWEHDVFFRSHGMVNVRRNLLLTSASGSSNVDSPSEENTE